MSSFTFFDFCAGIGAGRLAFESLGGKCLGFSEIDPNPEKTYKLFFGDEKNWGDLMKIVPEELPDFDVMVAGFPCQSFSICGVRKGMIDERGKVILGLINILTAKKVKFFLLENVKGLMSHEKGKTLSIIVDLLKAAGYDVSYKVLTSSDFGTPQKRERVYFVGIRKDIQHTFTFENLPVLEKMNIENYLISHNEQFVFNENSSGWNTFLKYLNNKYNQGKFNINELLSKEFLVLDTRQSDLRLYDRECPTLRKGRHGILYVKNNQLRKLSGEEALLLQGFPKELAKKAQKEISNNFILSQAGNAMTIDVMKNLAENFLSSAGVIKKNTASAYKQKNLEKNSLQYNYQQALNFSNDLVWQ